MGRMHLAEDPDLYAVIAYSDYSEKFNTVKRLPDIDKSAIYWVGWQ
jgi:hypothetical protein